MRGRSFLQRPNVEHVSKKVDPQSDVETIKTELVLADIATVDKALPRLEKEAKRDKSLMLKFGTAKKVLAGLNEGHRVLTLGLSDEELAAIKDLCLLTCKPMLYIANVDEDQLNAELPEIDGRFPCLFALRRKPIWLSSIPKTPRCSWRS